MFQYFFMKAEINDKNKFALYSQYILAEVPMLSKNSEGELNWKTLEYVRDFDCWIELKPLSSISDEDAIEAGKIYWEGSDNREFYITHGKKVVNNLMDEGSVYSDAMPLLKLFDFLRSRGYALSWMGLSVDELEAAGWIKLIENK